MGRICANDKYVVHQSCKGIHEWLSGLKGEVIQGWFLQSIKAQVSSFIPQQMDSQLDGCGTSCHQHSPGELPEGERKRNLHIFQLKICSGGTENLATKYL